MLGVLWYRRILLASPMRFFNNNIRFSASRSLAALDSVRMHMADAEIAHWIGFAAMLVLNVIAWWYYGFKVGLAHLIFNLIGNLYPCLLQQYNRHRLAKVIDAVKARNEGVPI